MPPRRAKKKAVTKKAQPALPQDADQLGAVLQKILTPDNDIIREGMRVLRAFIASPVCVAGLMQQLSENPTTGCRQLAAIALRKCIRDHWSNLGPDLRAMIRSALLERMLAEPSVNVRNSTVYLISTIAREDIPKAQWPELMDWVIQACGSSDPVHNDFGLLLLRLLLKAAPKSLGPFRERAHTIFSSFLSTQDPRLLRRALVGLDAAFGLFTSQESMHIIAQTVPTLLNIFEAAAAEEEVEVLDAVMVILSNVSDPEFPLNDENHVRLTTLMCNVFASSEVPHSVREKAMTHVTDVLEYNPALLTRLNLVDTLLMATFSVLVQIEQDSFSSDEAPHRIGTHLLNCIAENIPKKIVLDWSIPQVGRMLGSGNWRERCGGLLAFTTLMESCATVIFDIDNAATFRQIATVICACISDPEPLVRTSACVCLCNIADVDDSEHPLFDMHATLVPQLLSVARADPSSLVRSRALMALDAVCENLNARVLPYHVDIMTMCQEVFSSSANPELLRCAISVVKAVAVACRTQFVPYFSSLVDFIRPMLAFTADEQLEVRAAATECLGKAAFAVGVEHWPSDFAAILTSVFNGFELEGTDEFLLKQLSYVFFERVFAAWGSDAPTEVVRAVVEHALESLQSSDGVTSLDDDDEEGGNIKGFDDDSEAEEGETIDTAGLSEQELAERAAAAADAAEDEDEDEDYDGGFDPNLYIEPQAMEVKLEAAQVIITALGSTGAALGKDLFDKTRLYAQELCVFPYPLLRRSMLSVLEAVAFFIERMYPTPGGVVKGEARPMHPEAETLMRDVSGTVVAVVIHDRDQSVVAIALTVFESLLRTFGTAVMPVDGPDYAPMIPFYTDFMNTLEQISQEKGICQVGRGNADIDADADFEVLDSLCDLLGVFSEYMGAEFLPMFNSFLPALVSFMDPRRPTVFRSAAVGAVAEMIENMGAVSHEHVDEIARVTVTYLNDPSCEVAGNAAFMSGTIARLMGPSAVPHIPSFVEGCVALAARIEAALAADSVPANTALNARDNVAAALLKMSIAAPAQADSGSVFVAVTRMLPFKTDIDESNLSYPLLSAVAAAAPAAVVQALPQLVAGLAETFAWGDLQPGVRSGLAQWMRQLVQEQGAAVQAALATVPEAYRDAFMHSVNTLGQ